MKGLQTLIVDKETVLAAVQEYIMLIRLLPNGE